MGISVGRLDLDDAFSNLEDRDVEGSAAEVIHGNCLVLLLVESVGKRSRCGFVDDSENVEVGNPSSVFGGLPLGIVEVGWNGDHRVCHLSAEVSLCRFFQLPENQRGYL